MALRQGRPARLATRLAAGAVVLLAGVIAGAPQAAGDHGKIPPKEGGLPPIEKITVQATVEATHAQQTIALPVIPTIVHVYLDDKWAFDEAHVYLASPQGGGGRPKPARPHGHARFEVRTLAFGMIPAVVGLDMEQVVSGGDIEPWVLQRRTGAGGKDAYHANGRFRLRVTSLELDGQKVKLRPTCRTEHAGPIHLEGDEGYTPLDAGRYTMTGHAGIPAFVGCDPGSNGLDRVLTSAISGSRQPVAVVQDNG